jgi:predicted RNA polymerase sigma factor
VGRLAHQPRRRLHRTDDARLAYHEALMLAGNPVERDFIARRLDDLSG